ncbi:MAG: hypothetical protein C0497_04075 [Gemmatimonas sp.]|nr:hypothetical protein [Gemmatimonas sp.]
MQIRRALLATSGERAFSPMSIELRFDAKAVHDALTRAEPIPLVVDVVHDAGGVGLVIPCDRDGATVRISLVDVPLAASEARLLAEQGHYTESIPALDLRMACQESLAQRDALLAEGASREGPVTIWVDCARTPMTRREMPGFVVRDVSTGAYLALDGETAVLTHDVRAVAVFAFWILAEAYLTPERQIIRAGAVFPVARVR